MATFLIGFIFLRGAFLLGKVSTYDDKVIRVVKKVGAEK
jgi:hypothetical protein